MEISVVIPTCNRKSNLLSLLANLDQSSYPVLEVIIVDSSDDAFMSAEINSFRKFEIRYIRSEKSVCVQRNKGISMARASWIFICDDDIEVPIDYLEKIVAHMHDHPGAIAISGLVLQLEKSNWEAKYPIHSTLELFWKYIFKLSIWGEVKCKNNFISKCLKKYYSQKGNHISKAGWPVITNFTGDYFTTPVYGLGASLIKKEWLIKFPYSEVLDSHGIGDNYGVAINFPAGSIHVLTEAFVYHHQETINRLHRPLQYFRRVLALDYFRTVNKNPAHVKKSWLLWSLVGNFLSFLFVRDRIMIRPAVKSFWQIALGRNPYYRAGRRNKKIVEPVL